jgi:hypothetical protein
LLTITIKVNVPSTAESQCEEKGHDMKKIDPRRGIWDWLFGGGWCGGGSHG